MTRRVTTGRRGVTLILVAMLIVVLVGMVGVVLDFSRFYAYRVQMQTTADAAALAAVQEIALRSPATAPDTGLHYVAPNVVDGGSAFLPRDSIVPGIWTFPTQTFAAMPSFTTPGVNAVRVSVNHAASYTFGRVWQTADQNLRTTSTAAVGYVNTTSCLKPWAVSYQSLLDNVFPPRSKAPSYDLTSEDITDLSQLTGANEIQLLADPGALALPNDTAIAPVQVSTPWTNNSYRRAANGAPCANDDIGPSVVLTTDGPNVTPTGPRTMQNLINRLCTVNGGVTLNGNGFSCNVPPTIRVAAWDVSSGVGTTATYRVKYVAAFAVTGFVTTPRLRVRGYFTTMAWLGSVSSEPSPILEGILVK